ncbi:MAG: glutaminyl-peptide cyclotransferase [Flavobacterium sp.]|nr:MAG: glutaminyl-peptide cyclotransferase [Flavobacterium sp.]
MKNHNLLSVILLGLTIFSCGDENNSKKSHFSFDGAKLQEQYKPGESIDMGVLNAENKKIDSIVYYVNNKNIGSKKGGEKIAFDLTNEKLGYKNLKALVYFEGEHQETETRVELVSGIQPKLLSYEIVTVYPHDIKAYTQGLEFYRDTLFESTGNGAGNSTGIRGISSLRKTDYKTGKVYKQVDLENNMFGEGMTVLNNKVYQLTYREMTGFVYNADTFKREKTFKYFRQMEGWGLTNDGTNLYQSDGSEKIWILNPETLKEVDNINIYTGSAKVKNVNELEWVDGKIYGNVYQRDAIAVIDPKTGAVEAILDLKDLKAKVLQHPDVDVLNGIAYNPKTKTFFVTGKNWDKMFEIRIKG